MESGVASRCEVPGCEDLVAARVPLPDRGDELLCRRHYAGKYTPVSPMREEVRVTDESEATSTLRATIHGLTEVGIEEVTRWVVAERDRRGMEPLAAAGEWGRLSAIAEEREILIRFLRAVHTLSRVSGVVTGETVAFALGRIFQAAERELDREGASWQTR